MASRLLTGEAANWFLVQEQEGGWATWDIFVAVLRDYFIPKNEVYKVRDEWRNVKQGEGRLRDYVDKYRQIMLQVVDMSRIDKLHGFLFGLQSWVRREIEKQEPTSYEQASEMAERISDADNRKAKFAGGTTGGTQSSGGFGKTQSNVSKNVVEQKGESSSSVSVGSKPSGALMTRNAYRRNAGRGFASGGSSTFVRGNDAGHRPPPRTGCFTCGGPHWQSECPKGESSRVHAMYGNAGEDEHLNEVRITEVVDGEEDV